MLDFLLKLLLNFMKLFLSLLSLNFPDGFLVKTVVPNLLGNFILNLLAFLLLLLLFWGHGLRLWGVVWACGGLLGDGITNFLFNSFLNSFLNMIFKSGFFNISKWLNSLINYIGINA